jgi:hypothetical protein
MTRPLTVHNAQITTAAVEVKTLTISGKQVTLAVFRQLREEALIAEDGTLNGVPWGMVNYHPDKCGGEQHHLHVVWQRGVELLRAAVGPPVWPRHVPVPQELADGWLDAAILDGWRSNLRADELKGRYPNELLIKFDEGSVYAEVDEPVGDALWAFSHWAGPPGEAEVEEKREKGLAKLRERVTKSRQELKILVEDAIHAEVERRRRIDAQWKALNDLPQLFIAV